MHHRRSIRLQNYDYTQAGAYFITLCTYKRQCILGEVVADKVQLTHAGEVARECWDAIPDHFPQVELDAYVIMPNHSHSILVITVGATHASPLLSPRGPHPQSVGAIIGSFKSAVTKQLNLLHHTPGRTVWQRNYYEHIIRDKNDLDHIRRYIADNPAQWAEDENHPLRVS